jgi:hypothetical protein
LPDSRSALAGYYCPAGSTTATANNCGLGIAFDSLLFVFQRCAASAQATIALLAPARSVCALQVRSSSWNVDGVWLNHSLAGTYGATQNLVNNACSGTCQIGELHCSLRLDCSCCVGLLAPGYYCPAGSTTVNEIICPAVRFLF